MKHKFSLMGRVTIALVLALSLSLVMAVPVAAAALTVDTSLPDTPPNYHTIQAAIDAADTGDTINVAAGTYEVAKGDVFFGDHYGLKIDITKSGITLKGANAGIPGTGTRGDESIIEGPLVLHGNAIFIFDGADGVTVDGFTLRAYDDVVENRADNVVIENNIIESLPCLSLGDVTFSNGESTVTGSGFNTDLAAGWKIKLDADGVWAEMQSIESDTSLLLKDPYTGTGGTGPGSKVPDSNIPGIFACEADNMMVRHNLIQNTSGIGIFLGVTFNGTAYVTDSLIEYNLIDNTGYTGILAYATDGILIKNNIIRDAGPDPSECSAGVRENDGIRAGAYGSGLTIEYNDIYGCCYCGVQIKHDAATHTIHYNNIYGNQCGLENTVEEGVVDATNNWWGDAGGPGVGGANPVSENVDYDPWFDSLIVFTTSSSTEITATYTATPPPVIGIDVDPTTVSFGAVAPGVASGPQSVTVTNTGEVDVDLTAEITVESHQGVYTDGLKIDGDPVTSWGAGPVLVEHPNDFVTPQLILTVPTGTDPSTYTATLVFWAEATQ